MPSLGLYLRMVAAVAALVVVTLGFLAGVWAVFYGLFLALGISSPTFFATVVAALVVLTIGVLEYTHLTTIERLADAHPMDEQEVSELHATVTRVAAMLDIPVPTIAISGRNAPEAMAVGFRPGNVHLVLSRGTLASLSGPELEAVIAHELAHVKNRDAMVMTAVSLPVVMADGLRSRLAQMEDPGAAVFVLVPLALLSNVVWVLGRACTAALSRARERAADRAAVEATGSPAPLANALERLDQRIEETPTRDLREVSGVSSLSILPLDPDEPEKVMLGPEGDQEPAYWWLEKRLHRLERWLFASHPVTEERVAALSELQRER